MGKRGALVLPAAFARHVVGTGVVIIIQPRRKPFPRPAEPGLRRTRAVEVGDPGVKPLPVVSRGHKSPRVRVKQVARIRIPAGRKRVRTLLAHKGADESLDVGTHIDGTPTSRVSTHYGANYRYIT